jgi:hypothetical protein
MKNYNAFRSRGFTLAVAVFTLWGSARAAMAQTPPPEPPPPETGAPSLPPTPPEATPAPVAEPAPPAPPAPAAPQTGNAEADAAAASALADVAAATAEGEGLKLNLYGFTDFTYTKYIETGSFGSPVGTFAVGNFNLYMGSELGDNWRTLAEVRFSYLPNGTVPTAHAFDYPPYPTTDTTVPDYTDLGRPVTWGGIIIERVYVERTFLSWLTVRAGQFLTPFGIWNVDHGSPVIIGVRRPFIIGEGLFPLHQTGLEAFGGGLAGPVEVGYHLTLSNGRGPTDSFRDQDGNKAIGWRAWARHNSIDFGTVTLGVSGYRGKFSAATQGFVVDGNKLKPSLVATQEYDELSLAADLKWERGGALFQTEAVMNDQAYNNPTARRMAFAFDGGPPGYVPDNRRWGVYGLTGYRFQFLGIMPWIGGEYYALGGQGADAAAIWGGFNVRPTPRVVLKLQITKSFFIDQKGPIKSDGVFISDFQIAWSF